MAPSPSAFGNVHKSASPWREFWLQINSFVSAVPLNLGRVQMSHWALQSRDELGLREHLGLTSFWYSFLVIPESNSPFNRSDPSKPHKWIFFLTKEAWTEEFGSLVQPPQSWCHSEWQNLPPKDFGRAQDHRCSNPSPGWHLVRRGLDPKITPQSTGMLKQTWGWFKKAHEQIVFHLLSPLET